VILLFPIGSAKIKTFYSLAKKIAFKKKNPLARSATKAPKKKKLSFAGEKEQLPTLREKRLFNLAKTRFLTRDWRGKPEKAAENF
jgi:hypothetical protein